MLAGCNLDFQIWHHLKRLWKHRLLSPGPSNSYSAGQQWWPIIHMVRKQSEQLFWCSGACLIFETNGSDYLREGVEREKSKWQRTDLCGTQHQGGGLEKEAPVKEPIKEWSGSLMGKQQRTMSDNERFSPPCAMSHLLLHYHSPSIIFSKIEMFLFYRYFSIDFFFYSILLSETRKHFIKSSNLLLP